ncbi:MAG: DUF1343 domain-containing protein, partial [Polaribacter sp.]
FTFKPKANVVSKYPKYKKQRCFGEDLRTAKNLNKLDLSYLLKAYQQNTSKEFFNTFFTKLAGTERLQEQIEKGLSEKEIRKNWVQDIISFKKIRKKYLLYK